MKISNLMEMLEGLPQDYEVVLSKLISLRQDRGDEEEYEIILDIPITGIACSDEHRELRFVMLPEEDGRLPNLGRVIKIEE